MGGFGFRQKFKKQLLEATFSKGIISIQTLLFEMLT